MLIKPSSSLQTDFEKQEQILNMRAKIMQAEQERIAGEQTLCIDEARKQLECRRNG